jgi:hypothetical protein
MDATMDHIDTLNNRFILSSIDKYPLDWAHGKMGLCIYFYYLFRWEGKEEHKQVAEKLLNEVVNNLSGKMDITVENGLAGIALSISHLVKEKFVMGDINEILEDVDSRIIKVLAFLTKEESKFTKPTLILFLYYLYLRNTEQTSFNDKYIYQELIIKMIELFQYNLPAIYFNEHFTFSVQNYQPPLFLYVVSKLYDLNIYNSRLNKIMEEAMRQIISTLPVLQANRLYLLCGLLSIRSYLPKYQNEIETRIRLLKERIDVEHIINIELKNQDIYIASGVSLVYMLLYFIHINYPAYRIDFNPQSIYNKILHSAVWNTLLNREYYKDKHKGLYDGFPGANLVLSHIKKYFL